MKHMRAIQLAIFCLSFPLLIAMDDDNDGNYSRKRMYDEERTVKRNCDERAQASAARQLAESWVTNPAGIQSYYQIDGETMTPLHYCARHNFYDLIPLFIEMGAQIEITDSENFTPLHLAARSHYIESIAALLDAGAIFDARSIELAKESIGRGFSEKARYLETFLARYAAQRR